MPAFAFICGLLGIILSSVSVTVFAVREHRLEKRRTLSELAAKDSKTLREFRIILWTCGSLISVMMYFLVIPRLGTGPLLIMFYTVVIGCELLLAMIPARKGRLGKVHDYLAYGMGMGMLALAFVFATTLTGTYALLEWFIFGLMSILCLFAAKYWDHFLYFELPFIFLSHVSILLAAIAVL